MIDLYALLQYNLEKEGFQMEGSKTGKGAVELCRSLGLTSFCLTLCCRIPMDSISPGRASGIIPSWRTS